MVWVISLFQKLGFFVDYYKDLYSSDGPSLKVLEDLFRLTDLPVTTLEQQEGLEAPVRVQEIITVTDALILGKAAGPDGFTSEFYEIFKFILAPRLQNVFCSLTELKVIPPSWFEAFITLIPKEGISSNSKC